MRLLADENFPALAVTRLREEGHDVTWVLIDLPGSDDALVLQKAAIEERILITFDKDFGEMAFRSGLPPTAGVVLFRIPRTSPSTIAKTAVTVLQSRTDWAGHFSVIEANRIRMTPLPPSP
jgi:predicted nuclease of predicted toxin-antitoxin system